MEKLDSPAIVQIGIIVKDIHAAAQAYARLFGLPVPEVAPIATDEFAKTNYRGQPSSAYALGAYFKLGPVEMELIQPEGGPSTWEEFLRTHGEGVHHLAVTTGNLPEAQKFLASHGMDMVQQGAWDGGQYAYADTASQLGMVLELLHFDK